ncbi:hypothetical protein T11_2225, partial [Trichinella zimbabwensis]
MSFDRERLTHLKHISNCFHRSIKSAAFFYYFVHVRNWIFSNIGIKSKFRYTLQLSNILRLKLTRISVDVKEVITPAQPFYDSAEIQTLINGLHKYQPTGSVSGDSIRTLTAPGTVKIFATAPVVYSSDIYSNYAVKILQKSLQVYTPGTTTTVLRKSCAGTVKVENVLGPITVKDTVIPIGQDSARWSVPKSDLDFVCLSNTGRTAIDAKYGASVACILSKNAAGLFRKMITKENLDACPLNQLFKAVVLNPYQRTPPLNKSCA